MTPSLNSLFVTGLLLLFILVIVLMNLKKIINLDFYRQLSLLSLFVIAVGVHGLIHLGVETSYNFNPYVWFGL